MATSYYQSAFGANQPAMIIGEPIGTPVDAERMTRVNSSAAVVAYGLALVEDASDPINKAKLPTAVTDRLIGVAVQSAPNGIVSSSAARQYAADDAMVIQACGIVAMEAGAAITADDPVYIETSGADAGKPFPATNGVTGAYTLTLNKALAGGVKRVQTITFGADLITDNVVNMTIGGTAMPAVTFATSHAVTMGLVLAAIQQAIADGSLQGVAALADVAGTNRVITLTSLEVGPSTLAVTGAAVTLGVSQATITAADQVAGVAACSISVDVNGDTITTSWAGSSEATMLAFAEELEDHAAVTGASLSSSGLVLSLASASPLTLANAAVTGGEGTPATLTPATVTAGVAATRIAWTKARFTSAASDGAAVGVRFDARIP